jgi:hypothetical protein
MGDFYFNFVFMKTLFKVLKGNIEEIDGAKLDASTIIQKKMSRFISILISDFEASDHLLNTNFVTSNNSTLWLLFSEVDYKNKWQISFGINTLHFKEFLNQDSDKFEKEIQETFINLLPHDLNFIKIMEKETSKLFGENTNDINSNLLEKLEEWSKRTQFYIENFIYIHNYTLKSKNV